MFGNIGVNSWIARKQSFIMQKITWPAPSPVAIIPSSIDPFNQSKGMSTRWVILYGYVICQRLLRGSPPQRGPPPRGLLLPWNHFGTEYCASEYIDNTIQTLAPPALIVTSQETYSRWAVPTDGGLLTSFYFTVLLTYVNKHSRFARYDLIRPIYCPIKHPAAPLHIACTCKAVGSRSTRLGS